MTPHAFHARRWLPLRWFESRYFFFTTVGMGVGITIMLLAPFSQGTTNQLLSLVTGMSLVFCSVGVLLGLSERVCIHTALTMGLINVVYEATTTGGLFSSAMA